MNIRRKWYYYNLFWKFVYERQEVFFKKLHNDPQPWTNDYILSTYKFTNVYRVLDRFSQYMIQHVIYQGQQKEEEIIFRVLLARMFALEETYTYLEDTLGEVQLSTFTAEKYSAILSLRSEQGYPLFTSSYTIYQSTLEPKNTYKMYLELLEFMIKDTICSKIQKQKFPISVFRLLKSYYTIGNFYAQQYLIDINYTDIINFEENELTFLGPGAIHGLDLCFYITLPYEFYIYELLQNQEKEFQERGYTFHYLESRKLTFVDIEHALCEFYKYVSATKCSDAKYRYKRREQQLTKFLFPKKWNMNELNR